MQINALQLSSRLYFLSSGHDNGNGLLGESEKSLVHYAVKPMESAVYY